MWANKSQLKIQIPKCGVLHLGNNNPNHQYHLGIEPIPSVDQFCDLGVTMTSTLTFNTHIQNICKSANSTANLILRTFKNKRHDFMVSLFNTYVRPKLEYNSQIWNPHQIYLINRIEQVQRRFTKRLPNLQNISYENRLRFLKMSSLQLRRLHLDLVFLYKMQHGLLNINTEKYFEPKIERTRGNSLALVPKRFRKNFKRFSFSRRAVNIWNSLPDNIVLATTVPTFKKLLHSVDFNRFLRGHGLDV